jgi:hypothetical protein
MHQYAFPEDSRPGHTSRLLDTSGEKFDQNDLTNLAMTQSEAQDTSNRVLAGKSKKPAFEIVMRMMLEGREGLLFYSLSPQHNVSQSIELNETDASIAERGDTPTKCLIQLTPDLVSAMFTVLFLYL